MTQFLSVGVTLANLAVAIVSDFEETEEARSESFYVSQMLHI